MHTLARLLARLAPSQPADLSWLDLRDGRRLPVRHRLDLWDASGQPRAEVMAEILEESRARSVRHADISDEGRGQ